MCCAQGKNAAATVVILVSMLLAFLSGMNVRRRIVTNLVIIAVHAPNAKNLDEAYAKCATIRQRLWKGFEELPFRVALDSDPRTGTLAAFGIHGVPNTLVIDKNGKIAHWHEQPTKEARKIEDIEKAATA